MKSLQWNVIWNFHTDFFFFTRNLKWKLLFTPQNYQTTQKNADRLKYKLNKLLVHTLSSSVCCFTVSRSVPTGDIDANLLPAMSTQSNIAWKSQYEIQALEEKWCLFENCIKLNTCFFFTPENNIAVLSERKYLSSAKPGFLYNTRDQILTKVFHVIVTRTYMLQDWTSISSNILPVLLKLSSTLILELESSENSSKWVYWSVFCSFQVT